MQVTLVYNKSLYNLIDTSNRNGEVEIIEHESDNNRPITIRVILDVQDNNCADSLFLRKFISDAETKTSMPLTIAVLYGPLTFKYTECYPKPCSITKQSMSMYPYIYEGRKKILMLFSASSYEVKVWRYVEYLKDNIWHRAEFMDLKKGMTFRIFNPSGTPAYEGKSYIATSDAYINKCDIPVVDIYEPNY